jgi:hypothetical protein
LQSAHALAKRLGLEAPGDDWEKIWRILDEHGGPLVYLYAIRDHRMGLVKFGKSINPQARLKQMATGNAADLFLLGYCEQTDHLTGKEVHQRLKRFRVHGEWFTHNEEAETVIKEMRGRYVDGRSAGSCGAKANTD